MNTLSVASNQKGATIIFVAIILGVLVMFTALAVDVGYLYGVRNELQNAADAGALSGAMVLFNEDGSLNRAAALGEAERVAEANKSGNTFISVSVEAGDVEIGHWSFTTKTFTASAATTQMDDWQQYSFDDLDTKHLNFINAVRVKTNREAPRFFSGIFGSGPIDVGSDAVAYIGFPANVMPDEVDQPIAICREAITKDGVYRCDVGRMIPDTVDTGAWTNLEQPTTCVTNSSGADANDLPPLICNGNLTALTQHAYPDLQIINGQLGGAYNAFYQCWFNAAGGVANGNQIVTPPHLPFDMTLPVIICNGEPLNGCKQYDGIVNVSVIWVNNELNANAPYPTQMEAPADTFNPDGTPIGPFTCTASTETECWQQFTTHFHLGSVPYNAHSIYFMPNCQVHDPVGTSGGNPYGVLAKYPVLVE